MSCGIKLWPVPRNRLASCHGLESEGERTGKTTQVKPRPLPCWQEPTPWEAARGRGRGIQGPGLGKQKVNVLGPCTLHFILFHCSLLYCNGPHILLASVLIFSLLAVASQSYWCYDSWPWWWWLENDDDSDSDDERSARWGQSATSFVVSTQL